MPTGRVDDQGREPALRAALWSRTTLAIVLFCIVATIGIVGRIYFESQSASLVTSDALWLSK
jgi:hypothetical protein